MDDDSEFQTPEDWFSKATCLGAEESHKLTEYDLQRLPLPLVNSDEERTLILRKLNHEITCPICLGILQNTRAVMACLHRFCLDCINKCLRLGKKECPTCRAKCTSQRHLRPDTRTDNLIKQLYPDLEAYEKVQDLIIKEINLSVDHEAIQRKVEEGLKRQEASSKKRLRTDKPILTPEPPPKRVGGRIGRPPSKRGPGRPPKRGPGRPPKNQKSSTYSSLTPAQLVMVSTTVKADSVYHFQHVDQSRISFTTPIPPPVQNGFILLNILPKESAFDSRYFVALQRAQPIKSVVDYLYEKLSTTCAMMDFNVLIYSSQDSVQPLPNESVIFSLTESKLYYKITLS